MLYRDASDPSLPKSVTRLPKSLKELWVRVCNDAFDPTAPGVSTRRAWVVIRKVESAHAAKDWLQVDRQTLLAWLNGERTGVKIMAEIAENKAFALQERERAVSAAFAQAFGGLTVRVYDTYLIGMVPPEQERFGPEEDAMGATILTDQPDTYWKVAYNATTSAAGEEEVTNQIVFPPPSEWLQVAPTFSELKLYAAPEGRTRWVLVSSGGFEDRDGEIVSTAYLESAVDFAERAKQRGPLLVWHIPGSNVGTCDYQAIVGEPGMLLESGLFDATPNGERAAAYYRQKSAQTGASIRFLWANRTADGTYLPPGMILERSLLPRANAAFPWSGLQLTEVEAKMRKPRPDALAELAAVLGAEEADRIVSGIEANAKELADAGVRFKEVGNETEPEAETVVEVVATEPPAEDEAPETTTAKEVTVAEVPIVEQPAAPQAFDAVFSDETLKAMAEGVAATTAAVVMQLLKAEVTKSLQTFADALANMEKQIATLSESTTKLAKREDERIAEQVGLLPRATLKAITSTPFSARPSQRAAEAPNTEPGSGLSFAEIAKQTLYGDGVQA